MAADTPPQPAKPFGIQGVLPPGDPMRSPHLLGDDFVWQRWYATAAERDQAFADMSDPHPHYRLGDLPSLVLSKVDKTG